MELSDLTPDTNSPDLNYESSKFLKVAFPNATNQFSLEGLNPALPVINPVLNPTLPVINPVLPISSRKQVKIKS